MRHATFILTLLTVVLTGCSTLSSHPPRHLDFSGQWQLNESLSDDPTAVMREHRSHGSGGMHRHGGGMSWLNGPSASAGGGGHRGWSGNGAGRRGGPDNEFLARPAHLTIQQGAASLKLVADGVATDFEYGEKVMASVKGGAAERRDGWKGQAFVVTYDVNEGPKATRSYELGAGGRQLIVTTEISRSRGGSLKLRSVYDREPGLTG